MKKTILSETITGLRERELYRLGPEQKPAMLQRNSEEGFLLLDSSFKIITYCLSFRKHWVHFGQNICEGDLIFNKVPPLRLAFLENTLVTVLSGGDAEQEIAMLLPDQSCQTYFIRYKPAVDGHGKVTGIIISLTDITEYKDLPSVDDDLTQRGKTEQQKEPDNNNLKTLLNNTKDLMWSINRDYQLISSNKAFDDMIRKSPGNLPGMKNNIPAIGLSESTRGQWSEFYRRALAGETFKEIIYTNTHLRTWSEISFYPIVNKGKVVGSTCYSRNITETKNATQLLVKAYNEKTAILESITDGFLTVNKYWIVTYWNKEAERIMGLDREYITGKNIWEVFTAAVDLKFYSETHRALSEHKPVNFEEFFPPLNMWIDVSAYPSEDGLSIYFKNITERKLADEMIRIAKQRYEMVARATNDAIYEWDIISDTIYWNEGYETMFGHKRTGEIMPAISWIENLHPDEKENLLIVAHEAFKNKITSLSRELRFRCADGSFKIVFDKLVIRYDSTGQPTGIFGAMQDITTRKEGEIAIRELNGELHKRAEELIDSNAELERFAYVASHDLQEPLRMVSGFLHLLEKKYKHSLDETAQQYITYAVDGAVRMKRLILDLLEYSRVGTSNEKFVDSDMNAVIAQVLETFGSKVQDTGAIFYVQTLPIIKASKIQMIQLFQNLVSNSLKYTNSFAPEIEIGCEDKGDSWQFFVKDNGIGIEEKFFDRVFILFQRLYSKNQFSGTGIGLTICKKIVEKHGGTIWIKSDIGKGSTFFFTVKK